VTSVSVVKVGGSLSQNPQALRVLCQKLVSLSSKGKIIVVVPGGGRFADGVREADQQFSLSASTSHYMAILAMDQYGLLLADLMSPNSQIVYCIEDVKNVRAGVVAVFLPSKFITLMDKEEGVGCGGLLPKCWDVTSDSIAVCIARQLGVESLLLVKDVDGVFSGDPKRKGRVSLFEQLTIRELLDMENSEVCVDLYLPKLLSVFNMGCSIVNGFFPDRVEAVLDKRKVIGTVILSNSL